VAQAQAAHNEGGPLALLAHGLLLWLAHGS
jgi:hypothetical protein